MVMLPKIMSQADTEAPMQVARPRRRVFAAVLCAVAGQCLTLVAPAVAGPAVNQFETKDLGVEVGDLQFQSQNAFSTGNPKRAARTDQNGDLKFDDNSVTRERFAQEGAVPSTLSQGQFGAVMRADLETLRRVVKERKISAE